MERHSNYDDVSLLSISKAAQIMRVGKARIYDFIHKNKLKTVELNGTIRIPYFELRKCLEDLCDNFDDSNYLDENVITSKKIITTPGEIMKKIKKSGKANEQ